MSNSESDLGGHLAFIQQYYRQFWDELRNSHDFITNDIDEEISAKVVEDKIAVGTIADNIVNPKSYRENLSDDDFLQVRRVRIDHRDPEKLMDICFQFIHIIEPTGDAQNADYATVNGVTAASYLRYAEGPSGYTDDNRRPVEVMFGIHYDYDLKPDRNHPVFHAQYNLNSIKINALESDYEVRNRDTLISNNYPKFPRIPSSPLDLSGVVYMMLKDHTSEHIDWAGDMESTIENLPHFASRCFSYPPQEGATMCPEWWYVHDAKSDGLSDELLEYRESVS